MSADSPGLRLSVVMPAYNEEKLIADTIANAAASLRAAGLAEGAFEIIVCDNASGDATAELAEKAGARVVFEPERQIARAPHEPVGLPVFPAPFLDGDLPEVLAVEGVLGDELVVKTKPADLVSSFNPMVVQGQFANMPLPPGLTVDVSVTNQVYPLPPLPYTHPLIFGVDACQ